MTACLSAPLPRHVTIPVMVGGVKVGGGAPIVVQSMTNTDTADVDGHGRAGRGARPRRLGAGAHHRRSRRGGRRPCRTSATACCKRGINVPLIGDFHYIGHTLLTDHPACAEALDKYRINPGNVGFGEKRDRQFATLIELALRYDKPVRIGVNWGSLDQALLTRLMDENAASPAPMSAAEVTREAIVQSALLSAAAAEEIGLPRVEDHPLAPRSARCRIWSPSMPMLAAPLRSRAAPRPDRGRHGLEGHRRLVGGARHPAAAGHRRHHPHLADAGARRRPHAARSRSRRSCCRRWASAPSCRWSRPARAAGARPRPSSRNSPSAIEDDLRAAMPVWREKYPGVEALKVAVMGCIVNGPGESKHADIGISLPGTGEQPAAPVFIDGKKAVTLRGPTLADDFRKLVNDYVERRFGQGARPPSVAAE